MGRRRLGAAVLAALALLAPGCGSDDGSAGDEDEGTTTTTSSSSPDRSTPEGPGDIQPLEDGD
jgi:ABC-type glycerol-3-phosphate transport system substrate-binding protein